MELTFTLCHGSGNMFAMFDATEVEITSPEHLSVQLCAALRCDGILLLVRHGDGLYGMRMFNPDGSEAEMCGNGIRCVARLAAGRAGGSHFSLRSGGTLYRIRRCEDVEREYSLAPVFGVRIPVRLWSRDFLTHAQGTSFVSQPVPQLDTRLLFTAVSVGNPHIVARVERGGSRDTGRLRLLGERAAALSQLFPNGVNVSFAEHTGPNRIYVSTCERGAGITSSCGTAMTSSATAMALLGCVSFGERVEVRNAGGAVWCTCVREGDELCTELVGNATFAGEGRVVADAQGVVQSVERLRRFDDEIAAYDDFCRRLAAAE